MTINRKPGNEPDVGDMSGTTDPDAEARTAPTPDPVVAEEDEAAKLGDFA